MEKIDLSNGIIKNYFPCHVNFQLYHYVRFKKIKNQIKMFESGVHVRDRGEEFKFCIVNTNAMFGSLEGKKGREKESKGKWLSSSLFGCF